jgi:two-component system, OmpR family, response regulator
MKILILDDDTYVLAALKELLRMQGHEVDCISSASLAVQMAAGGQYDFILVDYKMPENDGIWFMKNARISRQTKVLLITAFVNMDIIKEMFALGASGYMIKPFDEEELRRNIEFYSTKQPLPPIADVAAAV